VNASPAMPKTTVPERPGGGAGSQRVGRSVVELRLRGRRTLKVPPRRLTGIQKRIPMPAKRAPAGLAAQAATRSPPSSRAVRSGRAGARTCPLTAHAARARTSRWARRRPAYRQRAVDSRCATRFSDSPGSPRSAPRIACRRRASPNTRRSRRHSGRRASVAWTCSRTTARSLLMGGTVGLGRLWPGHVKHATCCCARRLNAR
jgi:hypothetical protein